MLATNCLFLPDQILIYQSKKNLYIRNKLKVCTTKLRDNNLNIDILYLLHLNECLTLSLPILKVTYFNCTMKTVCLSPYCQNELSIKNIHITMVTYYLQYLQLKSSQSIDDFLAVIIAVAEVWSIHIAQVWHHVFNVLLFPAVRHACQHRGVLLLVYHL